jgi:excinuclease ABC subunit A
LQALRRRGFGRILRDGGTVSLDDHAALEPAAADVTSLAVVVDRVRVAESARSRLVDSIETAFREGDGAAFAVEVDEAGTPIRTHRFSERFECRPCGIGYEVPQPRLFSFNNPFGACPVCQP